MRVFITGTAGFIGFHLANILLKAGYIVLGYDGMTKYYDINLKKKRYKKKKKKLFNKKKSFLLKNIKKVLLI